MATIRVGFGSDFKVSDSKIGIGTVNPTALLEVSETAKADFNITGVTTLTSYGGFIAQNQYVNKPAAIGFATVGLGTFQQGNETETGFTDLGGVHHGDDQRFNTLSEDLVIDDGQILNITNTDMVGVTTIGEQDPHSHSSYVCAGSLEQVSVTGHFSVPSGGINDRESFIEGTVRFNTDLATLEFFNGNEWRQFTYSQQSGRGVIMGGDYTPALGWSMEYVQIPTLGNSQYFGELEWGTYNGASFASATRGLYAGGRGLDTYGSGSASYSTAHVDSITIASQGNSTSWGTMSPGFVHTDSCSNSTRGLVAQGYPAYTTVYYVTIATEGEYGTFGNLTLGRHSAAGCASPTRGIFSGGRTPAVTNMNEIDVFTIASLGNAVEFGKLSRSRRSYIGSCSNNVRGIIMGGGAPNPIYFSDMEYITIATNGNGQDFGDLTLARQNGTATATQIRGIYAGGSNPTYYNVIDYVTLTSLGNAQDFGDLTVWPERRGGQSVSDSHGGIGGF